MEDRLLLGIRSTPNEEEDDDFVRLADSVVKKAEKMKSLKLEDENVLSESFNKSMRVLSDNRSDKSFR